MKHILCLVLFVAVTPVLLVKAVLDYNAKTYLQRLNDVLGVNIFNQDNEDFSNRVEVLGNIRHAFSEGVPNYHSNIYSTAIDSSESRELASSKLMDSLLRIRAAKKRLLHIQKRLLGVTLGPGSGRSVLSEFERNQSLALDKLYRLDPVLNLSRRRRMSFRRQISDSSMSSSSSRELKDWKEEFQELWLHKKYEALNKSVPQGDTVNMVAARPWGVHCGDPNQHDMPWGSCMLAAECEPEYRIYRGDFFCGRTTFVCCALQLTTYDNYQGFDISLDEGSYMTSSNEKAGHKMSSRERRKKKEERDKKKRQRERESNQKKLVKRKKQILKEIRKIISNTSKNRTKERKKKTQQLKKFMENLKKQFKKDKKSLGDLQELEMSKIDSKLLKKLTEIKQMNSNFMTNSTFRNMVLNGTMTKLGARMLLEAYPELESYLVKRRSGDITLDINKEEYDLEYGYVYA